MDLVVILVSGVLLGGIYALVAIGLNLVFGVVRVVNFAHGEMVMLGMFGAYFFSNTWNIDPYISSFLLIAPAGFLLGVLVQRFIIQRLLDEPLMQMFATFGLLILLENIALALLTKGLVLALAVFGYANLWMAIGADVGASLIVTLNALRLLRD